MTPIDLWSRPIETPANISKSEWRLVGITGFTLLLFCTLNIVWLKKTHISFEARNWPEIGLLLLSLACGWLGATIVSLRLKYDKTGIAKFILRGSDFIRSMLLVAVLFIPIAMSTTIFTYVASATDSPLKDAALANFDLSLGFHWKEFVKSMNSPIVAGILKFAYHALGPQLPLALIVLAWQQQRFEILELAALLSISALMVGVLLVLVPSEGAYAYFGSGTIEQSHFSKNAGLWHHNVLLALRSGQSVSFVFSEAEGLVTFPSFHTTLGILLVYSVWQLKWLSIPLLILNAIMIVSTIPEGGHYLIDVLAGALISVIAICLVRKFASEHAPRTILEQAD